MQIFVFRKYIRLTKIGRSVRAGSNRYEFLLYTFKLPWLRGLMYSNFLGWVVCICACKSYMHVLKIKYIYLYTCISKKPIFQSLKQGLLLYIKKNEWEKLIEKIKKGMHEYGYEIRKCFWWKKVCQLINFWIHDYA